MFFRILYIISDAEISTSSMWNRKTAKSESGYSVPRSALVQYELSYCLSRGPRVLRKIWRDFLESSSSFYKGLSSAINMTGILKGKDVLLPGKS